MSGCVRWRGRAGVRECVGVHFTAAASLSIVSRGGHGDTLSSHSGSCITQRRLQRKTPAIEKIQDLLSHGRSRITQRGQGNLTPKYDGARSSRWSKCGVSRSGVQSEGSVRRAVWCGVRVAIFSPTDEGLSVGVATLAR